MTFANEKESLSTVDYERDIILKCISIRPRDDHRGVFELFWRNKKINFSASMEKATREDVIWDIKDIFTPKDFFDKKTEIKEIIIESLKKWGLFCNDENVKVKIKFSKHVSWQECQ